MAEFFASNYTFICCCLRSFLHRWFATWRIWLWNILYQSSHLTAYTYITVVLYNISSFNCNIWYLAPWSLNKKLYIRYRDNLWANEYSLIMWTGLTRNHLNSNNSVIMWEQRPYIETYVSEIIIFYMFYFLWFIIWYLIIIIITKIL